MLLRILEGPRKGEIQDLAPEAGRALLASGRAAWIEEDQRPAPEEPTAAAVRAVKKAKAVRKAKAR